MSQDENFILFSDIKRLFLRSLKRVLLAALLSGAVGFWMRTQVPVKHEIKATFKDGGKMAAVQTGLFENLLKNMSLGGEKEGGILMTSSLILEPVIKKIGLQALVEVDSSWGKARKRCTNALRAEKKKPLKRAHSFSFENISYFGLFPKTYELTFFSKDSFELREPKKKVLYKGKVGEPVVLKGASLTIKEVCPDLKLHTSYPLTIRPIQDIVLDLRSQIHVIQNSSNPGILELELFHTDLFLGKQILDLVMEEYQNYLISESERVSRGQIAYLERRRDELCLKMNEHLQSHVAYLKENLDQEGVLTLGQSLPVFQERKEKFSKELLELKLKQGKLKEKEFLSLGEEMIALKSSLHEREKERDALSLALFNAPSQEKRRANHLCELDQIERRKLKAKTGMDTFFRALLGPIQEERRLALETFRGWRDEIAHLKTVQSEKEQLSALSKKSFSPKLIKSYLENNIRLLSLQEEVWEKRLISGAERGKEYRGIDLYTARKLLLDYLQKQDDLLFKYHQMELGKKQFEKGELEESSLAELFLDSASQGLMREIGAMARQLRKKRTLTEKEIERLEKQLKSKKEDFLDHMNDAMEVILLEKEKIEERIYAAQVASLDLVGQEIILIEKQIEERISEKLKALDQEEQMIRSELESIKEEMKGIPDHWLREKGLSFSAEMNQGMLEALVHLVETKSIETNLSMIESKPINVAYASMIPQSPLLKVFGVVGALIGGVLVFAIYFANALHKGFPLSLQNMAMRGKNVVGTLTHHLGKDLEVFRNLSLLIQKKKRFPLVITFILGKKEDYSISFANLLAKEGKKVLVIDLADSKKTEEKNGLGLAHYLAGEIKQPPFQKKDFGDYLFFGESSLYSQELFKNRKFETFLEEMKQNFDVTFLILKTQPKKALPKQFFNRSDMMILRLDEESYDELLPYFNWEDEKHTLAFLG